MYAVGDKVLISDNGQSYSVYSSFFIQHKLFDEGVRFRYGVTPLLNTFGTIKYIEEQENAEEEGYICVIEVENQPFLGDTKYSDLSCYGSIYLINSKGLEKLKER